MNITAYTTLKIEEMPFGQVFTYNDIMESEMNSEALIKALNRISASGKIKKLSKGKFYKPEITVFGELQPDIGQTVSDLLEKDGKITGYLTGLSIFSKFGLTTQISNEIQIGRNDFKPSLQRGIYKIAFIKQKNDITSSNIPLLQLLDCIKLIKKIPDASLITTFDRICNMVSRLPENDIDALMQLALKYPPSTRALFGAIADNARIRVSTDILKNSLNPITTYQYKEIASAFPSAKEWKIV